MVDRAVGLADRLEGAIRKRRDEAKPDPKSAAPAQGDSAGATQERLRELLRRADPAGPSIHLSGDRPAKQHAAPVADAPVAGFPSRAERELRRALEGRRR
jgi:hypothetical protein